MKNVERCPPGMPFFRVPMEGLRLSGWAVQYVSGMEEDGEIEPGFWLSRWNVSADRKDVTFNFEPELHMCFNDEAAAKLVRDALQTSTEIETQIVRIP